MVVGVAGKYCSGKSTAVRFLVERGFREIDVDRLGHEALARRKAEVGAAFGPEVLLPTGEVDRKALGRIVFRDARERRRLEAIVHPVMVARVEELVREAAGPVVIHAAILFPMGLDRLCDAVLCVRAPLRHRIARARARDRIAWPALFARIRAQRRICPKHPGQNVDIYSVSNRGDLDSLRGQVEAFLSEKGVVS